MLLYAITTGDADGAFYIDSLTGEIKVCDPNALQGGEAYVLNVVVTDGESSDAVNVTINVMAGNVAPVINDFVYAHAGADAYTFQGTVIDENPDGMVITFGGILAGETALVQADGSFSITRIITPGTVGDVTAITTDDGGLVSNQAVDYFFGT
jgi:hypothetical protein